MDVSLLVPPLLAYLIGSIPFGLILTRLAGLGDIRRIGSGNIGATNVLRTGHKGLALATLALDFAKGFVAVMLIPLSVHLMPAHIVADDPSPSIQLAVITMCVTAACVIGHMFPVWLGFKGGKGVACIFGIGFALSPVGGLCMAAGWLALFSLTRYSSLGALLGIPAGLAGAYLLGYEGFFLPLLLPLLLMILKHHANIRRLLKGEEHRFSFSEKKDAA